MMSHPASVFVISFTLLNIGACLWLMWWTARTRVAAKPAQGAEPERTAHVWDGDLEEYNNPLPRWWLGLFILTVIFAVAYLVIYPGLGNFAGLQGWSQIDQYNAQVKLAQDKLEQRLAATKGKSLHELARDPSVMSTARNLFGANCSTCHGSDARGAKGFPNLTDRDWLWGGGEDLVYQSVANGRHGIMPALGEVLGRDGLNEVASYVTSLSGRQAPADWVAAGKPRFETLCAACHGVDGRGNAALGAPNLTDDIWLHGGDFESIRATVAKGRDNQMPAHLPLLGESKVRLLAAYVLNLAAQSNANATAVAASPSDEEPASAAAEPAAPADTQS